MNFVRSRILKNKMTDTIDKILKTKTKNNRVKMLEKKNAEYWRKK